MGGRDYWGGGREEDSFRWQSFAPRRLGDWQCSVLALLLATAGVVTITAVSASRLAILRNARLSSVCSSNSINICQCRVWFIKFRWAVERTGSRADRQMMPLVGKK